MTRTVGILAFDFEAACSARPDLDETDLIREALVRGLEAADAAPEERVPDAIGASERLQRLRNVLANTAAEAAAFRWSLVTGRERYARARENEQRTYDEHLKLDRDLVRPLKMEAQRLRRELRRLEAEAQARGIDAAAIEPTIDWSRTILVDQYQPPELVSNESRRKAAVEFFRRLERQ